MTTKQERREMWARALESGEYAQTRGVLRTDAGYCALGIGCDVFVRENPGGIGWRHSVYGDSWNIDGMMTLMPDAIARWYGMSLSLQRDISSANDRGKLPLAEIAKLVRL